MQAEVIEQPAATTLRPTPLRPLGPNEFDAGAAYRDGAEYRAGLIGYLDREEVAAILFGLSEEAERQLAT